MNHEFTPPNIDDQDTNSWSELSDVEKIEMERKACEQGSALGRLLSLEEQLTDMGPVESADHDGRPVSFDVWPFTKRFVFQLFTKSPEDQTQGSEMIVGMRSETRENPETGKFENIPSYVIGYQDDAKRLMYRIVPAAEQDALLKELGLIKGEEEPAGQTIEE